MNITPDWLTAIATVILVIATLIYVLYTSKLVKETTRLREVETTPFMSIFIKPTQHMEMVVENIGKAPAYNIEIIFDEKYLQCFLFDCTKNKNEFSFFSPNQQVTILLKQYRDLEKLEYDHIPIKIKYQSKDGRKFEEVFHISWKPLSFSEIQTDKLEDIKKELNNVTKEMGNLGKIIEEKEYFITNKLKILEFEVKDEKVSIVFSNGTVMSLDTSVFEEIMDIENIEEIMMYHGNLFNHSKRLTFLAEEVYDILQRKTNANTTI